MPYAVAILLVVISGLSSMMMVTLLCMGGANSTPQEVRQLKACIISLLVTGVICLVGSIWSMVVKKPWMAAGFGGAPLVVCVATFVVLWRMGR